MSDIPNNLKYTSDHEWIRIENENEITVGITKFAQGELGDIVYVEVETLNQSLEKESVYGSVEAVKTVSDLFMPVSGTVTTINPSIESQPELLNSDPYGEGWIIKIKISNLSSLDSLLSDEDYKKIIG